MPAAVAAGTSNCHVCISTQPSWAVPKAVVVAAAAALDKDGKSGGSCGDGKALSGVCGLKIQVSQAQCRHRRAFRRGSVLWLQTSREQTNKDTRPAPRLWRNKLTTGLRMGDGLGPFGYWEDSRGLSVQLGMIGYGTPVCSCQLILALDSCRTEQCYSLADTSRLCVCSRALVAPEGEMARYLL